MFICVEGNIGSGKSTLLSTLGLHFGHIVVKEPLHAWKHWLDNPHHDKEFFQCVVLQWYIIVAKKYQHVMRPVYVERSPFTANFVFSDKLFAKPSKMQRLHQRLYDTAQILFQPKAYVFLVTPPALCAKRLLKRNQPGDDKVSKEVLQALDAKHWAASKTLHDMHIEVLILDGM